MIAIAFALAAQGPAQVDPPPWPPCRNGAPTCASWERNWGQVDEGAFTAVIWGDDQTWSIQTRALATRNRRQRPRAWVKLEYATPNAQRESEVMMLYAFDCAEHRFALLHRLSSDTDGKAVRSEDHAELESAFEYVVPGTYLAHIAEFFCPA